MSGVMPELSLADLNGCLREMEACSRGLAYADHLYALVVDDLDKAVGVTDNLTAEAAAAAREEAPKGMTATKVKGRITEYIQDRPSMVLEFEKLREAQRRKDKLDRWVRSIEKRLNAAQSAGNAHQAMAKAAGYTP